jgi:alpha-mannosidase
MKDKWKLFIVPHFHFDVAWIKTYEDYLEYSFENILDVLHLVEKNSEYRFCLDQVALIEPFMKRDSELTETFRKFVRNGRIEIVCGMYAMPDLNIPSGEFLVRQFLFGKRFFKEKFGVDVKVGWVIDSFGHANQLPQILRKTGFQYYAMCRGAPKDLNRTEFQWEGLDGTRILTHWMIGTYIAGWMPPPSGEILRKIGVELPYITRAMLHAQSMRWLGVPIEKGVKKILDVTSILKNFASTTNIFVPNGADFTPPQHELLEVVKEINKMQKETKASVSTPSDFFKSVDEETERLPVVSGEFNPVFQGVYSSRISVKKKNRLAENSLLTAEKFVTVSSLFGSAYPEDELDEFTRKILFNHAHDNICGCGVDEVYLDAMKRFDVVVEGSKDVLTKSLEIIAGKVDTSGNGKPILIFNPLGWTRTDVAHVEVQFADLGVKEISLVDEKGQPVPFQVVREERHSDGDLKTLGFVFVAKDVPSIGYKTYSALSRKSEIQMNKSSVKAGENFIENEFFRVIVDPEHGGAIKSIYDKQNNREIVAAKEFYANSLVSERDIGDLYEFNGDSNGMATRNTLRVDQLPERDKTDISSDHRARIWPETGPVMGRITADGKMQDIAYSSRVTLYNGIRRVDFELDLDSKAENRRVRLCVPINIDQKKVFHEVPFGVAERGDGEYPAQNWVDYCNEEYGVSLINNGIPGNSITDNLASLTLLRSVDRILESHPAGVLAYEKGKHHYSYSIYPHKGDWREGESHRTALEFNNPLIILKTTAHHGKLPKKFSFISVSPANLVVTALKKNHKLLILRFYEATGRDTKARIKLFKPFKKVWTTNLLEEKTAQPEHKKGEVTLKVKKFEIVTLAFEF